MSDEQMGQILAEFGNVKEQIRQLNESVSKINTEKIVQELNDMQEKIDKITIDDAYLQRFAKMSFLKMI